MKSFNTKKIIKILFFLGIVYFSYRSIVFFSKSKRTLNFNDTQKNIQLNNNGIVFSLDTTVNSVKDLLKENDIQLDSHDEIIPSPEEKLYPRANITIRQAMKVAIEVDGKKVSGYTLGKTVRDALDDNQITLGRLDKTIPDINATLQNNLSIAVTRINIEEITVKEDIDFKIIAKSDDKLGWREKKIETPGEKGIKEVRYQVSYKNGKETSRVTLDKTILKEPVSQIEIQGTYVKTGKVERGQGTWYAYKGGMFAASLSIPKGGYAKVTNTANGKSIIVQINDSGPYGKGRIIDLDKVAFAKIASLGAGVIGVKVEEVLN